MPDTCLCQRQFFKVRGFDIGGCRRGVITSTNWRDLPVEKWNFVETETSLDEVRWREFAAPDKTLSPDQKPQNNANNDRCRDGDPDSN